MKRIGRGWQFDVFDLGNGRVKKVHYARRARLFKIFWQSGTFSVKRAGEEIARVDRDELKSHAFIRDHSGILDLTLLGHPTFLEDLSYEQDKVVVVKDLWKNLSLNEKKALIDDYVKLIYKTWSYGFADIVFNFSINNGINSAGNIIQIDFGELALTKEEVAQNIVAKRWLKSFSYLTLTESDIREYYRKLFDQELTIEKLNQTWQIAIHPKLQG